MTLKQMPSFDFLREQPDGVLLSVKVQPHASKNAVGPPHGPELRIRVTARPVDDAANEALICLLSEKLGCGGRQIEIVRGHKSRHKLVKIYGMTAEKIIQSVADDS